MEIKFRAVKVQNSGDFLTRYKHSEGNYEKGPYVCVCDQDPCGGVVTDGRAHGVSSDDFVHLSLAQAYNISTPRITFVHNTSYPIKLLMR